jgi:hypothetical protein
VIELIDDYSTVGNKLLVYLNVVVGYLNIYIYMV